MKTPLQHSTPVSRITYHVLRFFLFLIPLSLFLSNADAFEYSRQRMGLRLSGYGTAGGISSSLNSKVSDLDFIYDFRIRGQANYTLRKDWSAGAVYTLDRMALQSDEFARDLFAFIESPYGRIEAGITDSIAAKLAVGLPDVGGLRINDNSLIYSALDQTNLISSPYITGTRYSLRVNIVSVPTKPIQTGLSLAGLSDKFDSATDFALRFRAPGGKFKTSISAGVSYVKNPKNFGDELFLPRVTADSRTQISLGTNVQYNSINFGAFARGIYDKDSVGAPADGLVAGTGLSYDLLRYSISASYIFSDIGIWNKDVDSYQTHTGVLSLRAKLNKYFDTWMSGGLIYNTTTSPFFALGVRVTF